ncbi:MAG: hypothetical protein GX361_05765 [Bacteroidales bacterium]|nr:hypothetical protein [Bacteroidales bacterium]
MKKTIYILAIVLIAFNFSGCTSSDRDTVDLNADVDILSFAINGVKGTIDTTKQTIKLFMPPGTDLTNLSPSISISDGAAVTPASGTLMDFSSSSTTPIEYRVYSKNVYNTYKVTVEETKAKITMFKVGDAVGDIDEANRKITVYVPTATDLTTITPIIDYTAGATISPASGATVDFTNPVIYTLDYVGYTFKYVVTVQHGVTPGLVIFNGEDVNPIWGNIASTVESPYPNPLTDGINTTPFCASIMRAGNDTDAGGKPWSGGALWNSYKVNINPAEYDRFSIMILKEVAGDVQLEIQSDGEQNKDWLKVWYSEDNLGKWQKLIFKIPEDRTAVINNILVAPHVHDAGFTTQRMYWDELIALPKE